MSTTDPNAETVAPSADGATATDRDATPSPPVDESELEAEVRRRRWREAFTLRNAGVIYALLLLLVAFSVITLQTDRPFYLSQRNVANLLDQASLFTILAAGMTVLLISGSFDLSVGSLTALCAVSAAEVVDEVGFGLALVLALTVGIAGGLVNGLIHWKIGINPFIVTLGTLTAFRGVVLLVTDGRTSNVTSDASLASFEAFEGGFLTTPNLWLVAALTLGIWAIWRIMRRRPPLWLTAVAGLAAAGLLAVSLLADYSLRLSKPVYYMLAVVILTWLLLRYTVVGRRVYATGGNLDAARLAGIAVARYKVVPFALVGLLAGFVGMLFTAKLAAVAPNSFEGAELTVLAAAIVGGVALFGGAGDVRKTLVGGLLLFAIANGFNILNIGANFQLLFEGVLVVVAAAVYVVAERRKAERGT